MAVVFNRIDIDSFMGSEDINYVITTSTAIYSLYYMDSYNSDVVEVLWI